MYTYIVFFWRKEFNLMLFDFIIHDEFRILFIEFYNSIISILWTDEDVGFVIPVAGKQGVFVIGLGTTLAKLQWNLNEKSHQVTKLITVDADKPGNRWNDGKADINGYLWAGKCT